MSSEEEAIESGTPEDLLIWGKQESISSPLAAELLGFCDEDGAGDLFESSDNQQDQLLLHPRYEDVSSSAAAAASAAAADNSVCCYPDGEDGSFSAFSIYSLLDTSPQHAAADQEHDLGRYHSSSSSSSNPVPHHPPAAMLSLPPPALFVGDPFDHSGFALDPSMVPPVSTTGAPAQAAASAYEEESYATANGMGLSSFMLLDGIGMGAPALYCDGMLEPPPPPQGLFGGGMPESGMTGAPQGGDGAESGGMPPYGHDGVNRGGYSSGDMKVIGGGGQPLMGGGCVGGNPSPLPSSDMAAPDEPSCKVGRLSAEERKEKIKRYMKKRNNRNFSKKIKYACRKTLADSRPRVRGRFAKNDELGEVTRLSSSSHEFDDDEEEMVIKEEDAIDTIDSSDVLAHISSGVNPFKHNYPLESLIRLQ